MSGLILFLAVAAFADPGRAVFDAAGCRSCHKIDGRGGNTGPDLSLVGFRRDKQWLDQWLASPHSVKPATKMPEQHLKPAARAALVDFLSERRSWTGAPTPERMFVKAGCAVCHGPRGAGGDPVAPALRDSAETFSHDELVKIISDGKNTMPAWRNVLSRDEIEALAGYVAGLADKKD